ncbi:chromogranin-A [Periophthalmus magnuspinnatus]|uniref:chromogranin-A n=1 Tax=Periophthalmus magnuspinnatus TaxID=409849 RepID=UPI002436979B|nr:chromogranin-A [Periophthalmus magnuspinnatus]
MICSALLLFTALSTSVKSLPMTPSHQESEDVKVVKCIVEALADVLSKPRPLPVSQDCLLTLTTDERLAVILRHQNFLKELQEVALGGGLDGQKETEEEPPLQQGADDSPDRSMLQSVGGPGERSILSQERRGSGGEERRRSGGRGEDRTGGEVQDVPEEERGEEEEQRREESQKRRTKEKKGSEHSEKKEKKQEREEERGGDKRGEEERGGDKRGEEERGGDKRGEEEREEASSLHSLKLEEKRERDKKRGGEEKRGEKRSGLKLWSKRAQITQVLKKSGEEKNLHHSKEMTKQEVNAERRSPEEEELQLIVRTAAEEEGSGNKKESDIQSLASLESELERVAQRLHVLSGADRGQKRA